MDQKVTQFTVTIQREAVPDLTGLIPPPAIMRWNFATLTGMVKTLLDHDLLTEEDAEQAALVLDRLLAKRWQGDPQTPR